jgi:SAM-dependent methyltransferase
MTAIMPPRHLEPREILDAAVEYNFPLNMYFGVFEELGRWQLEALQAVGMRPEHCLLDIGCGAMRLGLSAVEYLNDGNYCGIDAFGPYVELARHLARISGLQKAFSVLHDADFRFERFGRSFDFAMAQSVFTHLSLADIQRCMKALKPVMRPGGKFLFTYLHETTPTLGFMYYGLQLMQRARIENVGFFQELGGKYGARFEALNMPHPTQMVGLFHY